MKGPREIRGLSLAILLVLNSCSGGGGSDPQWNVLILVPDTVRGDHLSVNGYRHETTPALDALAAEGVNFGQAITVAPRTWQSFSSILTGLYPPHHGVRFLFDNPLEAATPTIASEFGAAGWATGAFDVINFLERITRGEEFDHYERVKRGDKFWTSATQLGQQVLDWVGRERPSPFLAFVRYSGAHWPYHFVDPRFGSCGDLGHDWNLGSYGFQVTGNGVVLSDADAYRQRIFTVDPTSADRAHRIAHYDAAMWIADQGIGTLIAGLREKGLLEKTIVVVTSDHGESFGEHGYLQHGPRVDEPVMHVPLIVRLPRAHPDYRAGYTVDELVRVVDIMPTVLAAAGLPVPEGLDGVSLLPAIRGESRTPLWAYAESGRSFMQVDSDRHLPGVAGKHRMIRTADWKLVHVPRPEGPDDRLYDLRSDAGETRDVSAEHPDIVRTLREHLASVLASEKQRGEEPSLTSEEHEMLRELGYIQ